jgi:hypothetical protein
MNMKKTVLVLAALVAALAAALPVWGAPGDFLIANGEQVYDRNGAPITISGTVYMNEGIASRSEDRWFNILVGKLERGKLTISLPANFDPYYADDLDEAFSGASPRGVQYYEGGFFDIVSPQGTTIGHVSLKGKESDPWAEPPQYLNEFCTIRYHSRDVRYRGRRDDYSDIWGNDDQPFDAYTIWDITAKAGWTRVYVRRGFRVEKHDDITELLSDPRGFSAMRWTYAAAW